jgi:hypothetical protein
VSAADLRTLAIRRAGTKRKVALLAADALLQSGIEANGCTVLVDPPDARALAAFDPDCVVGFDGLADGDGAAFARIAAAAPRAELVFSCANAGSASGLVRQLLGLQAARGLAEAQVRAWLSAARYDVVARDRVVVPFEASGLALDAEAALRALFEQLNAEAAADRWLWLARPARAQASSGRTPGLLSVVVFDGPGREHSLTALDRQSQKPLEVVASVEEARGQYLALLMPGDLPSRDHFARLVLALQRGVSAWALESQAPPHAMLARGDVDCCAYVIDRERVGSFLVTLPRGAPAAEAVLFARLLAIFPPALVAGGPSYERAARPAHISEALGVLKARPLQLLVQLEDALAKSPEPRLRELLKQRVRGLMR